ncbi:hypothetical protein BU15DRAFT_75940 [Melanogaster broomeanus]|nr:hypothetical protein BU15DRAFT_75940 [Melanogaster broomeanus]
MTIVSHESRTQPKGEEILLEYADQVRHEWHDNLSDNSETFNIGLFNEALLHQISYRTWGNTQAEGLKQIELATGTSLVSRRPRKLFAPSSKHIPPTASLLSSRTARSIHASFLHACSVLVDSPTTYGNATATSFGTVAPLSTANETPMAVLSTNEAFQFASTGSPRTDATVPLASTSTSVRDVETRVTELTHVLAARRVKALTPYSSETVAQILTSTNLIQVYT